MFCTVTNICKEHVDCVRAAERPLHTSKLTSAPTELSTQSHCWQWLLCSQCSGKLLGEDTQSKEEGAAMWIKRRFCPCRPHFSTFTNSHLVAKVLTPKRPEKEPDELPGEMQEQQHLPMPSKRCFPPHHCDPEVAFQKLNPCPYLSHLDRATRHIFRLAAGQTSTCEKCSLSAVLLGVDMENCCFTILGQYSQKKPRPRVRIEPCELFGRK